MIEELEEQKKALISYMHSKLKSHDWHAVADAAMDLREVEAVLKYLREENEKFIFPGNVGKL